MQPQFAGEVGLFLAPSSGAPDAPDILFAAETTSRAVRPLANPVAGGDSDATVSKEEALRRERLRQRSTGILSFEVLGGRRAFFVQHGSLCCSCPIDGAAGGSTECFEVVNAADLAAAVGLPPGDAIQDLRASPDGRCIGFVFAQEVMVAVLPLPLTGAASDAAAAAATTAAADAVRVYQVTTGARGTEGLSHGSPDYLAQEELDRFDGFWWSPDGAKLLYQRTDERHIPVYTIRATKVPAEAAEKPADDNGQQAATPAAAAPAAGAAAASGGSAPEAPAVASAPMQSPSPLRATVARLQSFAQPYTEDHRYPFAGGRNPTLSFHVVDMAWTAGEVTATTSSSSSSTGGGMSPVLTRKWPIASPAADAGAASASSSGGVASVATVTGAPLLATLDVGTCDPDAYVPRVQWASAGHVALQVLNRRQDCIDLVLYALPTADSSSSSSSCSSPFSAAAGPAPTVVTGRLLLREIARHDTWINTHKCTSFLRTPLLPAAAASASAVAGDNVEFTWGSERTGFRHLYRVAVPLAAAPAYTGVPATPHVIDGAATNISTAAVSGLSPLATAAGPTPASHFSAHSALFSDVFLPGAASGASCRAVTAGEWLVGELLKVWTAPSVDAAAGVVAPQVAFFTAIGAPPTTALEQHLCAARLDASAGAACSTPVIVTQGAGVHKPLINASCTLMSDELSSVFAQRTSLAYYKLDPTAIAEACASATPQPHPDTASGSTGPLAGALVSLEASGLFGTLGASTAACGAALGTYVGCAVGGLPVSDAATMVYSAQLHTLQEFEAARMDRAVVTTAADEDGIAGGAADATSSSDGGSSTLGRLVSSVVDTVSAVASSAVDTVSAAATTAVDTMSAAAATATTAVGSMLGATTTAADHAAQAAGSSEVPAAPASSDAPAPVAAARVLPRLSDARVPLPAFLSSLPFIVRTAGADGRSPLFGAVFLGPKVQPEDAPAPTVVYAYGGPGVQLVRATCELRNGQRSYKKEVFDADPKAIVAMFDGRGSTHRGRAFEQPLRRRMGYVEVDDQAAAIAWLAHSARLADPSRVGIHGWSYGGYLTLRCMTAAEHSCFRAGVAGAPVTDWRLYDTCYTERYMGNPATRDAAADGSADYTASAVDPGAAARSTAESGRPWMVIHGDLDENVLFEHSKRLVDAGLGLQVVSVPGERHAIRKFTKSIAQETVSFLMTHLNGGAATANASSGAAAAHSA